MFGLDIPGLALGVVDKLAKAYNDWRDDKRQAKTENTGKQLQSGDDAKVLAKEGQDAARNEDTVGRMPDDQLNDLLR